jgi:hypothetical protein
MAAYLFTKLPKSASASLLLSASGAHLLEDVMENMRVAHVFHHILHPRRGFAAQSSERARTLRIQDILLESLT